MSTQSDLRANLITAIAAESSLAGVQILPGPPGENQEVRESIWIAKITRQWEWRSLGVAEQLLLNRKELLVATIKVNVYSEAPVHQDAHDDAEARADEITEAIVHAVAVDPSVGDAVGAALVESADCEPVAAQSGWIMDVTITVTAEHYPT